MIDGEGQSTALTLQNIRRYLLHFSLFALTFASVVLAGVQWRMLQPFELTNLSSGLAYAVALVGFLAAHEFGHYFAARYHGVQATLPYFIPFPSFLGIAASFGTMGAVIRIQSPIPSRKVLFDIGAAGPLAGLTVALASLIYGFSTLPPVTYLYQIHPEYADLATIPQRGLTFGAPLLYRALEFLFASPGAFVPPMNEMYHYPFLCAGWFGVFVTAMNLIPIGQLDGGHISFAMFGTGYHRIAQASLVVLFALGLAGFLEFVGLDVPFAWPGWLFWALLLVLFMRRFGLNRQPTQDDEPLGPGRTAIGWLCWIVLILSFTFVPFDIL